ncbi:MAG: toll/interleukin-1 receptor domain-containing protein [Calditrichia bacterium]
MKTKVFISYAKEDLNTALRLYRDLANNNIDIWFDEVSLLGGQRWKPKITEAIKESDFFFALLSKNSVDKRGYVQKELKIALEVLDEIPEAGRFIVPICISECNPSNQKLNELHRINIYENWDEGLRKILKTIGFDLKSMTSNYKIPLEEFFPNESLSEFNYKLSNSFSDSIFINQLIIYLQQHFDYCRECAKTFYSTSKDVANHIILRFDDFKQNEFNKLESTLLEKLIFEEPYKDNYCHTCWTYSINNNATD